MRYYDTAAPGLYRSRDGIVAGVCGGIANYLDTSPFWTRMAFALVILCTGLWPGVILYIIAAMVMKKDPYYLYY
jgi:phage shock protein C